VKLLSPRMMNQRGSQVVTVIDQIQVFNRAKQGEPEAIAQIINLGLSANGIRASVVRRDRTLLVLLESTTPPDPEIYVTVMRKGLEKLAIADLERVHLCGQSFGQTTPTWHRVLRLRDRSKAAPRPAQPKRSRRVPSHYLLIPLTVVSAGLGLIAGTVFNLRQTGSISPIQPVVAQSPTSPEAVPPASLPVPASPVPDLPPEPYLPPTSEPTPSPTFQPITIKAVGDIILGTNFPSDRLPPRQGKTLLLGMKPYLKGADIVFGNYESTFTTFSKPAKTMAPGKPIYAFRTPPGYVYRLQEAGFHVLSVANNHSFDFFERGFADTIRSIEYVGLQAVGKKNEIVYRQVRNQTIAFIGFSYLDFHNTVHDLKTAQDLVRQADKKADIVVVSYHAGKEGSDATRTFNQTEYFFGENRGNLIAFSRAVVNAGADLVLGHGPHVPRAIELYQGRIIAYSLGNFVGYRTLSTAGNLGTSLILQTNLDQDGTFLSGRIIPVRLSSDGIPFYDKEFRSVKLIQQLNQLDFPKSPLKIDSKGNLTRIKTQ